MTTDADRYAEVIAAELVEVAAGRLDGYDLADPADAVPTWCAELALDIEVTRSMATGDVTAVEVTRTLGGPGCWCTFRDGQDAEVLAVWGRDRAYRWVPVDLVAPLTDYLVELAEAVAR